MMLVVWLVVLPNVAHYPAVRRHIDRNRELQLEADGMFYTEVGPVEGMTIEHHRQGIIFGKQRLGTSNSE